MQDTTKVMLWGLGAMGSGMASMLFDKKGVEIVAALDKAPDKAGKDLGEVLGIGITGITVAEEPEEAFKSKPDIVLICTASFVHEVYPMIKFALKHEADVISIAEEMACPWAASRELADKIDSLACKHNKTVLGTGINPGFILDSFIISLTGVCKNVKHIHGKRVNDLAPFGHTVMQTQGVGTTPEQFVQGLESGDIVGHVGFRQSVALIANALGWELDSIAEEREPIITSVDRETKYVKVKAGNVAGCRHTAKAYSNGKEVIFLEHPQQICPEAEDVKTGDYIKIDGDPAINLAIEPEIPGGTGTIAIAVNMIPLVRAAAPGLLTMADLPIPRGISGAR